MRTSSILGATLCFLGLSPWGCKLFTSNDEDQIHYVLVKQNSTPLPVRIIELPVNPHDPTPSGCWYTLTEGEFGIVTADHTFGYLIVYRNSCGGYVLYSGGTSGAYERTMGSFVFHSQAGDSFRGHLVDDTLVVVLDPGTLYFKRDHSSTAITGATH